MSDEEKKAIERFKNFIYTYQDVIEDEYSDYEEKESAKEYQEVSEKILNLIEKQSKEIEKLQIINQMQKYRIEVRDERELISRDEVEKIITSEIKEIEKFKTENDAKTTNYHLYRIFVDEVLQSILDKIKGDDK